MQVGKDTIQDVVDMYLKMRICQINRKMSACLNRKHCALQRQKLFELPPDRTVPSVSRPSPPPRPPPPPPEAAVGPYQPPIVPQGVAIYNRDAVRPIPDGVTIQPIPDVETIRPIPEGLRTRPPWLTYPTTWDPATRFDTQPGPRRPERRPAEPEAERRGPTPFVSRPPGPRPTGPPRPAEPRGALQPEDEKAPEQKQGPVEQKEQPGPLPAVPPSPGYGVRPEAGEARFQHQGPLPPEVRAQIDYGAVPVGPPGNYDQAYQNVGDHRWYLRTGNEPESVYHYYWVYNELTRLWAPKHGRSRRTKAGRAAR